MLTLWTNHRATPEAEALLRAGTAGCRVIVAPKASAAVLAEGARDAGLAEADLAFGQPSIADLLAAPRLRWLQLSSAGYERYDTPEIRAALRTRGTVVTNSSSVFADPCAQHALAMMLALHRQLPASLRDQYTDRSWRYARRRFESGVLTGQTVFLAGYGAIGRHLAELLRPFDCRVWALRRSPAGEEPGVAWVRPEALPAALAEADHVVDLLPGGAETRHFFNTERFARMKPSARFYNLGRGSTVDQEALRSALEQSRLDAAFLDVTEPEPLPPDHPLWTARSCFITPHTAGGTRDQEERLARHFLENLRAFQAGNPLKDRVLG